jgi:hypothetical protein
MRASEILIMQMEIPLSAIERLRKSLAGKSLAGKSLAGKSLEGLVVNDHEARILGGAGPGGGGADRCATAPSC